MFFCGAITALPTPMRGGALDLDGLRRLVEWQISEGINGLVPCGTTGEAATLSAAEQAEIIRAVVEQTKKRVPVIAGASSNNTAHAVELSVMAADCGADALLHVTPYYNKPTPAGLVAHFRAVAAATKLPTIVYNVPTRTSCDMLVDTVVQISKLPGVVGIKEATGNIARGQQIIAACGDKFSVLSGDDATCLALTAVGGQGVISVISAVAPREITRMIAAARQGQFDEARSIHYRLQNLMELLFIEANPIPVKAAIAGFGFSANEVRLPLLPLSGEKLDHLSAEIKKLGLCP